MACPQGPTYCTCCVHVRASAYRTYRAPWHPRRARVPWLSPRLHLLRCADSSRWALLSLPDHSSPVNGALLVLKPNASLYEEGLGALRRLLNGSRSYLTEPNPDPDPSPDPDRVPDPDPDPDRSPNPNPNPKRNRDRDRDRNPNPNPNPNPGPNPGPNPNPKPGSAW